MTTKLDEIRAREQAATPGPWENVGRSVRVAGTTGGNAWYGAICNTIGGGYQSRKGDRVNVQARDNAAFIANARADIPQLLAVAEAAAAYVGARRRAAHVLGPVLERMAMKDVAAAYDVMRDAIAPLIAED